MEILKDKRRCSKCSLLSTCKRIEKFDNYNPNLCACSLWKDKKGHTYYSYTETISHKWISFRERHYGHPIKYILTNFVLVAIFLALIYLFVLENFVL